MLDPIKYKIAKQKAEDSQFLQEQLLAAHGHIMSAIMATFDTLDKKIKFIEAHHEDTAINLVELKKLRAAELQPVMTSDTPLN